MDTALEPGPGIEIQVEPGALNWRDRREWVLTATSIDSGFSVHLATRRTGITLRAELVLDERGDGVQWLVDGVEVFAAFSSDG